MNWIAIDVIGDVKGIYADRNEADCIRNVVMLITPDAEALASTLGNVRDNDRFAMARYEDTEDCIMYLTDSNAPVAEKGTVRLSFQDRLVNFLKYHDSINPDRLTDKGDWMVWRWMNASSPVWKIHSFSPDSATLIAGARVETGDVHESEPVFFVSSDLTRPLFLNVMEMLFTPAIEEDDYDNYAFSLMVTPSSTVRIILSFSVRDGKICSSNVNVEESSPDYKLYHKAEQFIRNFHVLNQCTNTPVIVRDADGSHKARLAKKGIRVTGGISRYSVSLSGRYRSMSRNSDPVRDGKEGKTLRMVSVSGFVRNQPCGPEHRERKLIWVDGFVRGQWVRSGLTYVTVS